MRASSCLEVHPELGIAPGLVAGIPTAPVIHNLTREEYPAADLPSHVVPGGEEVGIDHVDFFPNIGRASASISSYKLSLTGMIHAVG